MFKQRNIKPASKPLELSDPEDQGQGLEGAKKKVKVSTIGKAVITSSTTAQKQKLEKQVKESFDDINYKASNIILTNEDAAVMENLIDTDKSQDARAKLMENLEITKKIKQGVLDKNLYRGQNAYANYNVNEEAILNSKHKSNFAPLRAPTNIRISCRFDYNPELCKDWHDSGYCVFGNSCLYLHDRTSYKTGWELEKDHEQQERERWKRINNPDYQAQSQKNQELEKHQVQEYCQYCDMKLKDPVSLECEHIFCEACAIKLKKCTECGKKTNGIMNNAQDLLEKKRQRFEEVKKDLEEQSEMSKVKRKRFKDEDSQKLFM